MGRSLFFFVAPFFCHFLIFSSFANGILKNLCVDQPSLSKRHESYIYIFKYFLRKHSAVLFVVSVEMANKPNSRTLLEEWRWCLPIPLMIVSVKCTGVKNNGSGIRIEVEF
uniref:Putative secreted protein n=1 Tax=Ixodes scapularis TaxID=6945 RepID=A0A4D5RC76_IXOSC